MSWRDQKKFIDELSRYERNMTPKEKDEYKMFVKRQKDEEEFDTVSMKRLTELHNKYAAKKADKSKWDDLFKKK